jgi:AraC-like DNA-binding protein
MDVLASALAAMRLGPTRSARTEVHAPWGLRFRQVGGSTFHVVLDGNCWLLSDPGAAGATGAATATAAAAPVRLGTGDVVFLRHGTFAQHFTGLVGAPPLGYLTWWRMTLAERTLRESDAPLSAVARQVGYTSEFAFAKAFKREHGIAPGRYRSRSETALEYLGQG